MVDIIKNIELAESRSGMQSITEIIGGDWLLNKPQERNPCPKCGYDRGYYPSFVKKSYVINTRCYWCEEQNLIETEKQKAAKEIEYIKENIIDIIIDSGVPLKYKALELEAPNGELSDILQAILAGRSAYIYGKTGRGKSSFAVFSMKELILTGIKPLMIKWYDAADVCSYIRDGIDTNSYEQRLNESCQIPILFIDDIGKERPTANNKSIITELISFRYENRLQTIITSNLGSSEFIAKYDERTYSRVKAMLAHQIKGIDKRTHEVW